MRLALYRTVMRCPQFRGLGRLQEGLRRVLFPACISKVDHDLRLDVDPWEWTQITLLKDGTIEPRTLGIYANVLEHGDEYVDVGAHVGFHALVARRLVGSTGKIVAIDPQPYNCSKIMSNCRINDFSNVLTLVAVAGAKAGVVTLKDQDLRDRSRLTMALEGVNDSPREFRVPMIRLDQLFTELELTDVKLMKVDVEGYEAQALSGLGARIGSVRNVIVELLPRSLLYPQTRSLLQSLQKAGFELRTVDGEAWTPGEALPENNLWATRGVGS